MKRTDFRVGIVGTGYIAEYHAKALRSLPQTALAAVCDVHEPRAKAFAKRWRVRGIHTSCEEMIAKERLDAVHVLVPPDLHFPIAQAALASGVHVFLEKPLGVDEAQCRALARLAQEKGKAIGVSHNFLFHPAYERLRADVHEGRLGPIDHITVQWDQPLIQPNAGSYDAWLFLQPDHIALENGVHLVAHMLDLVGVPETIKAQVSRPVDLSGGRRFYRRWQVQAWLGRSSVDLNSSFMDGFGQYKVQVRGAFGMATADLKDNTYFFDRGTELDSDLDRFMRIRRLAREMKRQARRELRNVLLAKLGLSSPGNAYEASIHSSVAAFYEGLANGGRLDPRISAETGCRAVEQCLRIAQAAHLGGNAGRAQPAKTSPQEARRPARPPKAQALVLGGSGFIGRHLAAKLIDQGYAVRILTRHPASIPLPSDDLLQIVPGDIKNESDLDRAIDGVQYVFHLAVTQGKTWDDYYQNDVLPTIRIAELCLKRGVRRLIYTSTIDPYYCGAKAGRITEDTPLDPYIDRRNYYARCKALEEKNLLEMHRSKGLPVVIFRPGIVIGSGGSPCHWGVGMWRGLGLCRIWGDGNNKLPLVLVEDVAAALALAIEAEGIDGRSYNLVDEPCLTAMEYLGEMEAHARFSLQKYRVPIWRFFVEDAFKWTIKNMTGHPDRVRRPSYRDWESRTMKAHFDCSRAKQELGWKPCSDRQKIISRGIHLPLDEILA